MRLNLGCGPHRARAPWINVDRVYVPGDIEPDLILPSGRPADLLEHFERGTVTHVYMGHVLEHVRWEDCAEFLAELFPLLTDDGQVCVVGPDVQSAIEGFKSGIYPWSLVSACLEGSAPQIDGLDVWHDGARHQWNCTEERVVNALTVAGFASVEPMRPRDLGGEWPLVSPVDWQCAVIGWVP